MDANILLSKIVANPTTTTWAQAYSTLNLYVVLSLKAEVVDDKSIVLHGKELLERIQREYFSQDQKTLENIKKSIEDAISEITDLNSISIILATIAGDSMLIVTVSGGKVILKRGAKIGEVATGVPGEVGAFSGKIEPDDIIILETEDFTQKIPAVKLSPLIEGKSLQEISENIAPIIHGEPLGSEAAIILQYKKAAVPQAPQSQNVEENVNDNTLQQKDEIEEVDINDVQEEAFPQRKSLPKLSLPIGSLRNKKGIMIVIVLLIVVLIGSIIFEQNRRENSKREKILSEILIPAQKKYDEADALITLNKGLALDEFINIKTEVTSADDKLPESSSQQKKLTEFISKLDSKIQELSAGSTLTNQKEIFKNVDNVIFRDKELIAADADGKIYLLKTDGSKDREIDSKNGNVRTIASDETSVFVLGEKGVTRSTKTGTTKTIIEDPVKTSSLDTFGVNLYGLNTDDKTVDKYSGASYTKSGYFTEDVTLTDPQSMSIDGSIWILDDTKIKRFTKGKEVSFTVTGLTKPISDGSQIYTNIDYLSVYILDPGNNRIISITKDGDIKDQYVSKDLKNATSFAIDEEGEKVYVIISGNLFSFDL